MSRREEVEAMIAESYETRYLPPLEEKLRSLADEIDALRAEADPDALTICYMQGQAQGDAEARAAQEVVTKLLAMLKLLPQCEEGECGECDALYSAYARACAIAGRTE